LSPRQCTGGLGDPRRRFHARVAARDRAHVHRARRRGDERSRRGRQPGPRRSAHRPRRAARARGQAAVRRRRRGRRAMTDQHSAASVASPNPVSHGPVSYGADHRFNLSSWTLEHQALVIFILSLVTLFGVLSYGRLAQSEDPPFTFKVMVIRTFWPGATARQVQEEVTDVIARKLQEVPAVDFQRSYSRPGESTLFFTMKDTAPPSQVPATWYQVRKKVGDIANTLPAQ